MPSPLQSRTYIFWDSLVSSFSSSNGDSDNDLFKIRLPAPFFGQCLKEIDFCYGRCSLGQHTRCLSWLLRVFWSPGDVGPDFFPSGANSFLWPRILSSRRIIGQISFNVRILFFLSVLATTWYLPQQFLLTAPGGGPGALWWPHCCCGLEPARQRNDWAELVLPRMCHNQTVSWYQAEILGLHQPIKVSDVLVVLCELWMVLCCEREISQLVVLVWQLQYTDPCGNTTIALVPR